MFRNAFVQFAVLLIALHAYKGWYYGFGVSGRGLFWGAGHWRCGHSEALRLIDPTAQPAGIDLAQRFSTANASRALCLTHATNHTGVIIVSHGPVPDSIRPPHRRDQKAGAKAKDQNSATNAGRK